MPGSAQHIALRRPGLPDPTPAVVHSVSAHAPQPVQSKAASPSALGAAFAGMCVALLAAVIFFDAWSGPQTRFTYSDASARFAVTVFIGVLIGAAAARLAGRSKRVFAAVFCVVMAAQIATRGQKLMHDRELRDSLSQPDPLDRVNQLIERQFSDPPRPKAPTDAHADEAPATQRAADTLENAAVYMGDQEATYARAVAAFQRTLAGPDHALDQAARRVVRLGGLDVRGVQKRAELDTRYSAYQDFEQACLAQEKALRNAETWLRVRLTRDGFPADLVSGAVTAFLSQSHMEATLQLRAAEVKRARVARDAIALLKARWEQWKADPATGALAFADAGDAAEYRKITSEWTSANSVVARLEQQLGLNVSRTAGAEE